MVRAMPYILLFSLCMIFFGFVLPHHTHNVAPSSIPRDDGSVVTAGEQPRWPTATYLLMWTSLVAFALRFIVDQGVEFVAYPSLNRDVYDENIKYDGSGWQSGRNGRGPGGVKGRWGGNRKGGRYAGMGKGFVAEVTEAGKAAKGAVTGTRRGYAAAE